MKSYSFFVPGDPVGKQRPRVARGHAFTPRKTVLYENAVIHAFLVCKPHTEPENSPTRGPMDMALDMFYRIPESASKKQREKMLSGEIPCIKRPDVDNVCKSIMDALNGYAYYDDSQVIHQTAEKHWGITPGVQVTLKEIENEQSGADRQTGEGCRTEGVTIRNQHIKVHDCNGQVHKRGRKKR